LPALQSAERVQDAKEADFELTLVARRPAERAVDLQRVGAGLEGL
jgi:hypothetical protein